MSMPRLSCAEHRQGEIHPSPPRKCRFKDINYSEFWQKTNQVESTGPAEKMSPKKHLELILEADILF